MKIDVKIYPVKGNSNLKANVALTLEDLFVIKGFKVVQGKNGLFVSKPKREYSGKYYDDVYLLDENKNNSLNALILSEYNETIDKNNI